MKDQTATYDLKQILLHWASAVIIIWAMASGIAIGTLPMADTTIKLIAQFNVSITFVFIPFFAYRIFLRRTLSYPEYQTLSDRHARIALVIQRALYCLVSLVLISGVLMLDHPYQIFNLFEVPPVTTDTKVTHAFKVVHSGSSYLLACLIGLHVTAAILHAVKGNEVFSRMLPSRRASL